MLYSYSTFFFFISLLVSSLSLLVSGGTLPLNETAVTPFGRVHRSCVHYAPRGAVIKELEHHVELHHRDGRIEKFEACEPIDPRRGKHEMKPIQNPLEAGMDLEGWIDYTGWYPQTSGYEVPINSFVGYNNVPDTPANTNGQTLYWFIGMQNNEDSRVRILQPVLTFNGVGGGATGAPNGWSFMSWNCCPKGQVWYSDPITDFAPGDTVYGEIVTNDGGNTYTITSASEDSSTVLTVDTAGLTFDWADVTLEVYSVSSCNQFPTEAVKFTDLQIQSNGVSATPNWKVTQGNSCHDAVAVVDAEEVDISATPK